MLHDKKGHTQKTDEVSKHLWMEQKIIWNIKMTNIHMENIMNASE